MKRNALILTAVLFACSERQEETSVFTASLEDEKALRYLKEVEWPQSYREQDTLLLDRILGDEYELISANGGRTRKQDELQWIKENAAQNDSFYFEIKRLDILENGTAIITGTGHVYNDSIETLYESSNILVKRGDLWKAVASHVSGIRKAED